MKILQLSSARQFGGGERHFVDLTNGLRQRGHDLYVALTEGSPLLSELSQIPTRNVLTLPFRHSVDLISAWRLRRFARDQQIEVIHAHVARDYPLAALAADRSSGATLVLTRHVLFPMSKVHRLTRRRVARVIAVSQAVAAELRFQQTFDEQQITVVRHGIDLASFQKWTHRTSSSELLRVGILGELSLVKGQTDFVKAAAIVAAERDDVEFVIAGRDNSADGKYSCELKRLIAANELGNRVQLIESTIDVAEFFSQLDVFVSASHSEAFGLAIVEAMACGVPVIATATDGAREIIRDKQTGRLVPVGGTQELAGAIQELLADGSQRETLARHARRMVIEGFSLDRMIDETEKVFREVLSEQ